MSYDRETNGLGLQHAPVPQDGGDVALTEEQEQRFRAENVTLHRHFLENLDDAKYARATGCVGK